MTVRTETDRETDRQTDKQRERESGEAGAAGADDEADG